jgi:hypothetical protein
MAAPTNAAKREESSCQYGAVHTWHLANIRFSVNVRFAPEAVVQLHACDSEPLRRNG